MFRARINQYEQYLRLKCSNKVSSRFCLGVQPKIDLILFLDTGLDIELGFAVQAVFRIGKSLDRERVLDIAFDLVDKTDLALGRMVLGTELDLVGKIDLGTVQVSVLAIGLDQAVGTGLGLGQGRAFLDL